MVLKSINFLHPVPLFGFMSMGLIHIGQVWKEFTFLRSYLSHHNRRRRHNRHNQEKYDPAQTKD